MHSFHSSSLVDAHHPVCSYVKRTFDPRRLFLSFIFLFVAYSSSIYSIYIAFIDKSLSLQSRVAFVAAFVVRASCLAVGTSGRGRGLGFLV